MGFFTKKTLIEDFDYKAQQLREAVAELIGDNKNIILSISNRESYGSKEVIDLARSNEEILLVLSFFKEIVMKEEWLQQVCNDGINAFEALASNIIDQNDRNAIEEIKKSANRLRIMTTIKFGDKKSESQLENL